MNIRSSGALGFLLVLGIVLTSGGCTILTTRPVQEMSNTSSAIRAAREVQADTIAPELYRQSNEWFLKAKHEYKFKNFKLAQEYADKARVFAEQAEFEALRNGGVRTEAPPEMPSEPTPMPEATPYPTPTGTPADVYDERKAEEEARKQKATQPEPTGTPFPPIPSTPVPVTP